MRRLIASLSAQDVGETYTLEGWIHQYRNHGSVIFFNLRDHTGIVQIVVDEDSPAETNSAALALHLEYCVAITGLVCKRPDTMVNTEISHGDIEILAKDLQILSKSPPLPYHIHEDAREEMRMQYRYLDIRSQDMQAALQLRSKASFVCRTFLHENEFTEVETPTMIRSTPEGARDFLVPSRLHPESFYALAQSPQLYKQMLMVGGVHRYMQFARCYRDEDIRGDRQPEHTQIDLEMSFLHDEAELQSIIEALVQELFHACGKHAIKTPFPRFSYHEIMNRYGGDKADIRGDLVLQDISSIAKKTDFGVFTNALSYEGSVVKMLRLPQRSSLSRKQITELEDLAKKYGAKGLAWTKVGASGCEGGIARFLEPVFAQLSAEHHCAEGDLLLFAADSWKIACTALGAIRSALLAETIAAHPADFEPFAFAWVTDFPLFEKDDAGAWTALHHPFTRPRTEDQDLLATDPGAVRGHLYDLVCNGYELGSGSLRIHDTKLQKQIFSIIGIDDAEAERRFGFFLQALEFAPPPHGGIAIGFDRLCMILAGKKSIRDVIAFPKNNQMASTLDFAPSVVHDDQLEELYIQTLPSDSRDT